MGAWLGSMRFKSRFGHQLSSTCIFLFRPATMWGMFFSWQMVDRQEGKRGHVMFLTIPAGDWHSDSSLSEVESPGQPNITRAEKVTLPMDGVHCKRPMAKGKDVQFLIQRGRKVVGTIAHIVTAS